MWRPVNHGDTVRIACTPLNIPTFRGYLKTYAGSLCMDWQDGNETDALTWIVGSPSTKWGQPLRAGEGFVLISSNWMHCITPGGYNGTLTYDAPWSRAGQVRPDLVLSCNGIASGTPIVSDQIYWVNFASEPGQKWAVPSHSYLLTNRPGNYPIAVSISHVSELPAIVPAATSTTSASASAAPISAQLAADPQWDTSFAVPKKMYLTVDDSTSEWSPELVRTINELRVQCVFFINGGHSIQNMDSLREICKSPYITVAIHTFSHANMASQLTLDQARKEIADTIALVEQAHRDVGKVWPAKPRLFRYPFTDGGQGYKHIQLEAILKDFGFHKHTAMQACLFGSGLGISGLFLNDGVYDDKPRSEYMAHVKDSMEMFRSSFPAMFDPMVFGTHDRRHEPHLIRFLHARGVEFLDARETFAE